MGNDPIEKIWEELKSAKSVLMSLHPNPDGDSAGSCTAMKYALEKQGVKVKLVSRDKISENLGDFEFAKDIEFGKSLEDEKLEDFDIILFLDHGSLNGYSEEFQEKLKNLKTINIDHHFINSRFGKLNYVAKAPACCSILTDLFESEGIKFDRKLSLCLLVGICTDTGFFLHGDSVDSMEKAIFLLKESGLNYERDLFGKIMNSPWKIKKLHGIILTNMKKEEIEGKTVAYSWAKKSEYEKQGLKEEDIRLAVICMTDIRDVDLVFVLTEVSGKVRGSFRSTHLDTTIYSTEFGGGGHKKASAFKLKGEDAEKTVEDVLEVIRKKGFVEAD